MAGLERVEKVPRQIGVQTLRGNPDAILREAQAGTSFPVTSQGAIVAEIHPLRRLLGLPVNREPCAAGSARRPISTRFPRTC